MVVPPHVYFIVSAVFHYLGPAFAVLLFARVDVLGVAWLRIASAAARATAPQACGRRSSSYSFAWSAPQSSSSSPWSSWVPSQRSW